MILTSAARAKIKAARRKRGLTGDKLAELCGLGTTANSRRNIIAHIENTTRPISPKRLKLIADELGIRLKGKQ